MATRPRTTMKQKTPGARLSRGTTSVMDSLRAHEELAALMPTVTRLTALQKDCSAFLPEIFGACTVLRFDSGQLVLSAPNAAIASRLKQTIPKLQEHLCRVGWQVNVINSKVQPDRVSVSQNRRQKAGLPQQAIAAFSVLQDSMKKTPQNEALNLAITALLKKHQNQS